MINLGHRVLFSLSLGLVKKRNSGRFMYFSFPFITPKCSLLIYGLEISDKLLEFGLHPTLCLFFLCSVMIMPVCEIKEMINKK